MSLFGIADATIRNGIFKPKTLESVWLFITEQKTSDRTQYQDQLTGDVLYMEGQTARRTDRMVIDHKALGLELLVFHRKRRLEYAKHGFRYEGSFQYESHRATDPGRPTKFVLRKQRASGATLDVPPDWVDNQPEVGGLTAVGEPVAPNWYGHARPEDLRRAATETPPPGATKTVVARNEYHRRRAVAAYVKASAGGRCEACGLAAPFADSAGAPFLETHHTTRVADGGPDDPQHVAGICPNCHRRAHYSADSLDFNAHIKVVVQHLEPPE